MTTISLDLVAILTCAAMGASNGKVGNYSMAVSDDCQAKVAVGAIQAKPVTLSPSARKKKGSYCPLSSLSPLRLFQNRPIPDKSRDSGLRWSPTFPWLIKEADFRQLDWLSLKYDKIIFQGKMSTIRLASLPDEPRYFVVKSIRKDAIHHHDAERHVRNEKACMLKLHSPFCVKLFGTFFDRNYIFFALEYLPGGDLFQTRLSHHLVHGLPAEQVRFYMSEVACALEHIHSLRMVHRNLSPENMGIDEEGHIKLIDFGFATPWEDGQRMMTMCGQPAYMSPEQLSCISPEYDGYGMEVDWWSYGIILYQLLTGKTPFWKDDKDSYETVLTRIRTRKVKFASSFDSLSKGIVDALLKPKLALRLTSDADVKKHPYFKLPWDVFNERKVLPPFIPTLTEASCDTSYFRHCSVDASSTMGKPTQKRMLAYLNDF